MSTDTTGSSPKSVTKSQRANARVAELLSQKRRSEHAGGAAWTEEQQDALVVAQGELAVAMSEMAREMIIPHLEKWLRPKCGEIPATLSGTTRGLIARLRGAMETYDRLAFLKRHLRDLEKKELADAKIDLRRWAKYQRHVQRAESEGASRAATLMNYWSHCLAAGDSWAADQIGGFLHRNWALGGLPDDINAAATRMARRDDLISDELRLLGRRTLEIESEPEPIGGEPVQICAPEVM